MRSGVGGECRLDRREERGGIAHRVETPTHALATVLPWPFVAWSLPGWYFAYGFGWWRVSARQLAELAPALAAHASVAATLAVAARLAGVLLEAGFYVVFWRTRGARLPFWRYVSYLVLGSLADLQALDLASLGRAADPHHAWIAVLAGPGAAPHAFTLRHPIVTGAFAGLGLITLVRWCWTAWAQAVATGRPLRAPLVLTAAVWLATHLAAAAALALARGRSVTP